MPIDVRPIFLFSWLPKRKVTRLLHEAAQSAEAEKQRKFKEISAQLNTEIRMDDQTMQRAITAVIRCVCGH